MNFKQTEEQTLIREGSIKLINACVAQHGMPLADESEGSLWREMAAAGYLGVLASSEYEGSALGLEEAGQVLLSLGERLASAPFATSAVAATIWLNRHGTPQQKEEWLPKMVQGSAIACPLLQSGHSRASFATSGNKIIVSGRFSLVPHANVSDFFLVEAVDELSGKPGAVLVERGCSGVEIERAPVNDAMRSFFNVKMRAVELRDSAFLRYGAEEDRVAIRAVGAAAMATEMLGGASSALYTSRDYAKDRRQFGVAIGSFQSLKHMLADQLVALEGIRSAVLAALWSYDHDPDNFAVLAALAKQSANDGFLRIASEGVQVHGAFGFSEEAPIHRYLKRARLANFMFGTSETQIGFLANHLDRLAS